MADRFSQLLIALVLVVFLSIFESETARSTILRNLASTYLLVTMIRIAAEKRWQVVVACVLGIPWVIGIWLRSFGFIPEEQRFLVAAAGIALFLFSTALTLLHVATAKRVTTDVLLGACSVYLLLGFAYELIYSVLELLHPGSFTGPGGPIGLDDLAYYSFVTLTTLGYGDILPVTPFARGVAVFEAITGVLYTTIILARLMGLYLTQIQEQD